jgi:type I restriction enzyme S subunit
MGVWELPAGWKTAKLGDLVEMKTGFACAKKNLVSEGISHLRPFNVGTNGEIDFSTVYEIPEDFRAGVDRYDLEPGHILFNNTNSVELVGKTALVREPLHTVFSNHITRLTVNDVGRVSPAYVVLALRQLWSQGYFAANCNRWIGQAGFNTKMLAEVEIPLPEMEVQYHIVARVEALFAELAEAQRLQEATVQDTEQLISATSAGIFAEAESKGWPFKTVGNITRGKPQYGTSQKAMEEPIGVPILRMGNIIGGRVSFDDLKYIDLPPDEEAKYLLHEGDILFNRTNSAELVGKCAVYPSSIRAVFASYLIRVVADHCKAIPEYVVAYINSPLGRQYIQAQLTRSIGQVNVNAKKLQAMPIPLPTIPEQRHIVAHLNDVQTQVAALRRTQETTAAELERLEQAILAQAFRGGEL